MTADVYDFNIAFLKRVSSRITNEIDGISRVSYDRKALTRHKLLFPTETLLIT